MAWLMESLLYQDPGPQEFCLHGHSRVREWSHGAIPGQGLHLFQVTRVLANAVHPEAAAVRAAEGKGNLGPEGRGRAAWGTSSWTSQAVLEEDRAPMPPEYPTCLGTRVWAGGTLRPTPKPEALSRVNHLSPCSTTSPCALSLSFLQISPPNPSSPRGRTRAWEGWFPRLRPALAPWGLLPFPHWSLAHPGHQLLVSRGQWTYRTFPLSQNVL